MIKLRRTLLRETKTGSRPFDHSFFLTLCTNVKIARLWEAIRLYMVTCRKELNDEANRWMGNTIGKLKKRLEVRLATHKPRYPRVKTMIYEVRLKELQDHLNQLDRLEEVRHR
jgi:hypothetical protein